MRVTKSIDQKLKNSIFKPYQITKPSQTSSSTLITLDTLQVNNDPHTFTSHINTIQNYQTQTSDEEAFQEETFEINELIWRNPTSKKTIALDRATHNEPAIINQHKINVSSIYEWNIDGIFEYNIINTLQQMTMTANAYKTQIGTSDKAIVELLIAGFSRQLKGWWGYYLTP